MELQMKSFKQYIQENYVDETGRCWVGYKPKPNKKAYSKGSCVKENHVEELENDLKYLNSHDYHTINDLMIKIAKKNNITSKQLHNDFKNKHGKIPDDWIKQNSKIEKHVNEDGMGAGAAGGGAVPTNNVGSGNIAGTGGKGGEPGVDMKKKRKSPIMLGMGNRKIPN
jgi:hypothetical protein